MGQGPSRQDTVGMMGLKQERWGILGTEGEEERRLCLRPSKWLIGLAPGWAGNSDEVGTC